MPSPSIHADRRYSSTGVFEGEKENEPMAETFDCARRVGVCRQTQTVTNAVRRTMACLSMACLSLACLALIALAGCGTGAPAGPELIPVSGAVTLDGTPLAHALVTFIPDGATLGAGGSGMTDAEGKYRLVYGRGGQGVAAGQYRVTISKRIMPDGSDVSADDDTPPIMSPAQETLAAKCGDQTSTTLTANVGSDGSPIDFALTK